MNSADVNRKDKNFLIRLGAEAQAYFGMNKGFTIIEVITDNLITKVPYESLYGYLSYETVYLRAFKMDDQGAVVYMGYSPLANMLLIRFEE